MRHTVGRVSRQPTGIAETPHIRKRNALVSVAISFPPFASAKAAPLISQNWRYQVLSTGRSKGSGIVGALNQFVGDNATVIFPVLPALAATLLQRHGHEAIWLDGTAEGWDWESIAGKSSMRGPI